MQTDRERVRETSIPRTVGRYKFRKMIKKTDREACQVLDGER